MLLTGAFDWSTEEIESIRQIGHNVVFMQQENDALPCAYSWVEGIIGNGIFLHHPIDRFINLKYVQLTSAGYDRVSMEYISEHNIEIHNARGVYSIPMAEFAICGVLRLYKNSLFFDEMQKTHKWEKKRNLLELYGKKVCILGCGSVGVECSARFKAFGCTVIGFDIEERKSNFFDAICKTEKLTTMISEFDIIILTLPFTKSTFHFINEEYLNKMKSSSVLVNISRGQTVDTQALSVAIQTHAIGGAVLDVFETEPLDAESPLWDLENVVITPHNSFVGEGNHDRMSEVIFENLKNRTAN